MYLQLWFALQKFACGKSSGFCVNHGEHLNKLSGTFCGVAVEFATDMWTDALYISYFD